MYKFVVLIALGFFLFLLWVIYLANTGGNAVFFDWIRPVPYGDKLGHMGLFGFLTLVVVVGSRFRTFSVAAFNIYYGVAAVVLFVIAEECSQAFIPSRTFDFIDLAADFVGITGAAAIAYLIKKHLLKVAS